jgi:hypothetical protein
MPFVSDIRNGSVRVFRSIVFRQSLVRDGDVMSQLRLRTHVARMRLSDSMTVGAPIDSAAAGPRYFTGDSMRADLHGAASAA